MSAGEESAMAFLDCLDIETMEPLELVDVAAPTGCWVFKRRDAGLAGLKQFVQSPDTAALGNDLIAPRTIAIAGSNAQKWLRRQRLVFAFRKNAV